MASIQGTTGVFRPGHVLKGVARELGRSECFLVITRYLGRIVNNEQTKDGHSEVLVDHSTDAGVFNSCVKVGKWNPKRPTIGKVKQGITYC